MFGEIVFASEKPEFKSEKAPPPQTSRVAKDSPGEATHGGMPTLPSLLKTPPACTTWAVVLGGQRSNRGSAC